MEAVLNTNRNIEGDGWQLGFWDGLYQIYMAGPSESPIDVALHGVSFESDALKILKLFGNLRKN